MSESYQTASAEETFSIGERLGATLEPGSVVLLYGGLGAGKTVFVKGVLNAHGYDPHDVTSPSFALVNLYRTDAHDIYHIDLWRLETGPAAAMAVGLYEILENANAIVLIEWAEKLGEYVFGQPVVKVIIDGEGDDPRTLTIKQ